MSTFSVTILGVNSAIPAHGRHLTAQVVNVQNHMFMVDCGEGTQMQLFRYKVKFQKISHIFISHLHGDHVFGLIGLLMSMNLNGRTAALTIHGPQGIQALIEQQFELTHSSVQFPLHFNSTSPEQIELLYEDELLTVHSIPLKHRVPTHGFLFKEKKGLRKMCKEAIEKYAIPFQKIPGIKEGNDFVKEDGTVIENAMLTNDPAPPRAYAFCSDTMYHEAILEQIKGVDLLYHEATFLDELADQAIVTMHTTARQAGKIARLAGVRQLLLGHFSSRYQDLEVLAEEAGSEFERSTAAKEGMVYEIPLQKPKNLS